MHRAHICNAFDVCNVQHTLRLYTCSELLHVIPPGAIQLRKFVLGWQIRRNHESWKDRNEELERSPEEACAEHEGSICKRVLVCAFMGHPHAVSPWLKPAVLQLGSAASMISLLFSDCSGKSLRDLTASLHTGPECKIFTPETSRNKYLAVKYLGYIPRDIHPPPFPTPIHLCSVLIMQKVMTRRINFKVGTGSDWWELKYVIHQDFRGFTSGYWHHIS